MTVIGDATRNTMIMFYLPKREINMKLSDEMSQVQFSGVGGESAYLGMMAQVVKEQGPLLW